MSNSLQTQMVSLIPSKALRAKIVETGFHLPPLSLLNIAYYCSPDYASRIENLRLIEASISGKRKAYAARLAEMQGQMLEAFQEANPRAVYELHIMEEPHFMEEVHLCASWAAAKALIRRYYQEYECRETSLARYRIVKRRVFLGKEGEPFPGDFLGEAILLPGGVLYSVDVNGYCAEDCDGFCSECADKCVCNEDVPFPVCTKHLDAVTYLGPDCIRRYGVVLEGKAPNTGMRYIIPLDSEQIRYHNFENFSLAHKHIPTVLVDPISPEALPPQMKEDYEAFLSAW